MKIQNHENSTKFKIIKNVTFYTKNINIQIMFEGFED